MMQTTNKSNTRLSPPFLLGCRSGGESAENEGGAAHCDEFRQLSSCC